MRIGNRAQLAQKGCGRGHEAAFAEHRFDDERRDSARCDFRLEEFVQRCHRPVRIVAAARIGIWCIVDFRNERPEVLLVRRDLAGQRGAKHGAAVKPEREAHDGRAAGCLARDLHRVLDGFGAGRHQQRLLFEIAGRERVHALRDRDVSLVKADLDRRMRELLELRANRCHHGRMTMPDVERPDAAREVDQFATVLIPDPRTFGARDGEERVGRPEATGEGLVAAFEQVARPSFGRVHDCLRKIGGGVPSLRSGRRAPPMAPKRALARC